MEENEYKSELRKIKLKQKQMSTQLKLLVNQNVSLLDASLFENLLKSMDTACFEVTNSIDEMILDLEEFDGEYDDKILDLEEIKERVSTILKDSKHQVMMDKNKKVSQTDNYEAVQTKDDSQDKKTSVTKVAEKSDLGNQNIPKIEIKETKTQNKVPTRELVGKSIGKRATKKIMISEEIGEGLIELATEDPAVVVLELVLGTIGEQLGVKGTTGFLAAALTHYAISQFAVLIGVATSPIKMDFSGITQAKILKKLEDLNNKVDLMISSPRTEALEYLKDGLIELAQTDIDFQEANEKFKEVKKLAKKAISMDTDFTNFAVCTKYLVFAETMVQAFTQGDEETNNYDCFLPAEKLTESSKNKMVTYLSRQVGDLKKRAETKGKKKEDHRDKVDDILKLVYNVISVCKNLSNPNTLIINDVTFGIDTTFIPYGEEDATALPVGRVTVQKSLEEIDQTDLKKMPAYMVYLWRSETVLFVRREMKVFEIPLGQVHATTIWVKLEEKNNTTCCKFGENKDNFENMANFPRNCLPKNIQRMTQLFETAKSVKDMDSLPKRIYEQMQRFPEVYLSDLGINVSEKDSEEKTLLHYVACLNPGLFGKTTPIDCLVDAGADLASQDANGQTPLMAALVQGSAIEKNIKTLINHCEGTLALNIADNFGNNVLHLVARMKESKFTKDIIKMLLKVRADPTQMNKEGSNPRDYAHQYQNWSVEKILHDWLNGKEK